jgi:hypothetical protein
MDGVAGESQHTYIRNVNTTSVSGGDTHAVTVGFNDRLTRSSYFLATLQGRYPADG